jgi:hypothetical protein
MLFHSLPLVLFGWRKIEILHTQRLNQFSYSSPSPPAPPTHPPTPTYPHLWVCLENCKIWLTQHQQHKSFVVAYMAGSFSLWHPSLQPIPTLSRVISQRKISSHHSTSFSFCIQLILLYLKNKIQRKHVSLNRPWIPFTIFISTLI